MLLIFSHRPFKKRIAFLSLCITIAFSLEAQEPEHRSGVVDSYGQLHISGSCVVNANHDTVTLEGMSLFWSQWIDKYYNYDCIKWLRDDFHCDVIRAAMAIEYKGYLKNPEREKKKVFDVIDACIDLGVYVIVDWHSHAAHLNVKESVEFFSEVAGKYREYPNIIYEIYNEPVNVTWDSVIRPYCEQVIAAIRKYDPDNIVIVGTPQWSQDVDKAADNPLSDPNVAYALHFYAGTHKQWLRDKADVALSKGLAVWISEFGTCKADGKGNIDFEELNLWFDYMDKNMLSWCNWSVADKKETASIVKPGSSGKGNWSQDDLTASGKLIREKIRMKNP